MSVATAELPVDKPSAARAVVWGGLLAGVGDIAFAFVVSGLPVALAASKFTDSTRRER